MWWLTNTDDEQQQEAVDSGSPEAAAASGTEGGGHTQVLDEVAILRDQFDQQQQLIEQLKDLVRDNERQLRTKEQDLVESATRLSKMKLQYKAKISQLTGQLQDVQNKKQVMPEDSSGVFSSSSSPEASVADASRGKVLMLKRQLEENRVNFEKREKLLADDKRSVEHVLEKLRLELSERDQVIESLTKKVTIETEDPNGGSQKEVREMYAQVVYKDTKILELNGRIVELEGSVMDLKENLKEKDQVIQSRNQAIQLMTEDLSRRGKIVVDQLDDTRDEMRQMQHNFATIETEWKQEESRLRQELDVARTESSEKDNRITELRSSVAKLDSVRFDLSTRNAGLQEKIVQLRQNLDTRSTSTDVVQMSNELETLRQEVKHKDEVIQELQDSLSSSRSKEPNLLKLKAQHKSKIKALEAKIANLEQGGIPHDQFVALQNQLVELEEDKGNLQLRLVDMDELVDAQARHLSTIEELKQKQQQQSTDLGNHVRMITILEKDKLDLIERLKAETEEARRHQRALEDGKVALELRLVTVEESRDVADNACLELRKEVEMLEAKLSQSSQSLASDGDRIEELERALRTAQDTTERLAASAEDLRKELDRTRRQWQEAEAESRDRMATKDEQTRLLEEDRERLRDTVAQLDENLREVAQARDELVDECASVTRRLESSRQQEASGEELRRQQEHLVLRLQDEVASRVQELDDFRSVVEQKSDELRLMSDSKELVEKQLEDRVSSLMAHLAEAQQQLEAEKARSETLSAQLQDKSEDNRDLQEEVLEDTKAAVIQEPLPDSSDGTEPTLQDEEPNGRQEVLPTDMELTNVRLEVEFLRSREQELLWTTERLDTKLAELLADHGNLQRELEETRRLKEAQEHESKNVLEGLRTTVDELEATKLELSAEWQQHVEKAGAERELLENKVNTLETLLRQSREELDDQKTWAQAELGMRNRQLDDVLRKYDGLATEHESVARELDETRHQFAGLQGRNQELANSVERLGMFESEFRRTVEEVESLRQELEDCNRKNEHLGKQNERLMAYTQQLESDLTATAEQSGAESHDLKQQLVDLRNLLDEKEETWEAQRDQLRRELERDAKDKEESAKNLERTQEELAQNVRDKEELAKNLERTQEELAKNLERTQEELAKNLERTQEELERSARDKEKLSETLEKTQEELERNARDKEELSETLEKTQEELARNLERTQEELAKNLERTQEELERSARDKEELSETLEKTQEELARNVKDKEELAKNLERTQEELAQVSERFVREEQQFCQTLEDWKHKCQLAEASSHERDWLQSELERLGDRSRELEDQKQLLLEKTLSLQSGLDETSAANATLQRTVTELAEDLESTRNELANNKSTVEELTDALNTSQSSLGRVRAENDKLKEDAANLLERLQEQDSSDQARSLSGQLAATVQENQDLRDQITSLEETTLQLDKALTVQKDELTHESEALRQALESLKTKEEQLSEMDRVLTEQRKTVAIRDEELDMLRASDVVDKLTVEVEDLDRRLRESEEARRWNCQELESQLDLLQSEKLKALEESERKEVLVTELERTISDLRRSKDQEAREATEVIGMLDTKCKKLEDHVQHLTKSKGKADELVSKLEDVVRQSSSATETLSSKLDEARLENARLEERLRQLDDNDGSSSSSSKCLTDKLQVLRDENEDLRHKLHQSSKEEESLQQKTTTADEGFQLRNQLAVFKIKNEKMLTKLKLFKDKNDKLQVHINDLMSKQVALEDANVRFQEMDERANDEIRRLQSQLTSSERFFRTEMQMSRDRLDMLEVANDKLVEMKENVEQRLTTSMDTNRALSTENESLRESVVQFRSQEEAKAKTHESLLRQVESLRQHNDLLDSDNREFQALLAKQQEERARLEREVVAQAEKSSQLQARYDKLADEDLARLRHDHDVLQKEHKEVHNVRLQLECDVEALRAELEASEEHKSRLDSQVAKLRELDGDRKTEDVVETLEEELRLCRLDILQVQEASGRLTTELDESRSSSSELEATLRNAEERNRNLMDRVSQLEGQLWSLEDEKQQLQDEMDESSGSHRQDGRLEVQVAQMQHENGELTQKLSDFGAELDRLRVAKEQAETEARLVFQQQQGTIQDLRRGIGELQATVGQVENELDAATLRLKDETDHVSRLESYNLALTSQLRRHEHSRDADVELLRTHVARLTDENVALEQQLHNIKKHLGDVSTTHPRSPELDSGNQKLVEHLEAELHNSMQSLHRRDLRCEELTSEMTGLIEERDSLQLRLSAAIRSVHEKETRIQFLLRDFAEDEQPTTKPDAELEVESADRLQCVQQKHRELLQLNAVLDQMLTTERESGLRLMAQLKMAKEELANYEGRSSSWFPSNTETRIAMRDDEDATPLFPEHSQTLVRLYMGPAWRISNWLQGRSTPRVLHV